MRLIHLVRALTVELDLLSTGFARSHHLHPTDVRALVNLLDAERAGEVATPGRLGRRMGLNSPATTALVDRLEQAGHIRRERDTSDRRRVRLVVSHDARALGWSFFGPVITEMLAATESFDAAELAVVQRFLESMNAAVAGA